MAHLINVLLHHTRGGSDQAKIQCFRSGATAWPPICCTKENEKRIQTLFDCFNTGGMTLNEYLAAIKHLTGL